ncbi:PH domain-containing protein [Microseira sp. BLCC-F43]|uniref:PH domain-containing protein n=1 Tax=Microseira sp. BLCC-F43 TaxID=3153602 RepID=UPI0035B6BEDC
MFKKLAAETLGISDIGTIVAPANYDKVDADDYLFHEDGEKIFFLIKSKKDEYCFTNFALIHVDGDSAVSSKRVVKRYEYADHKVSNVVIQTAGTIDLDVELKFGLEGGAEFIINVNKNCLEGLKDIYKALIAINRIQKKEEIALNNAYHSLELLKSMYKIGNVESEEEIVKHFNAAFSSLNVTILDRCNKRNFSDVFEKYIRA